MTFDLLDRLDGLRCRDTAWLQARRAELVGIQREAAIEELAVIRVLDERDAIGPCLAGEDGVSSRTVREKVETARALESLPEIAAAAHDGALSSEQLAPLVELADEFTDAEWAARGPNMSPADLTRQAREQRKPTLEESQARWRARSLRMWWNPDKTMLHLRGDLPDLLGAKVEATIQEVMEENKPGAGQTWDTHDRRAADALGVLCERETSPDGQHSPTAARKPVLSVQVPPIGPATVAGVPLPDAIVEQLRANATIEPVLIDEFDAPVAVGRRFSAISPKIARAVLLRDGHCRCVNNCDIRHGLEIHHLIPRSWGGTDDFSNLAAVFGAHHRPLIPHGPWALVGNPNQPDGLRMVRYDQLSDDEAQGYGLPPPSQRRRE
ncbi:MAG: DUF222 domain-containing protein [Acidimicrobiia bacterium]